MGHVIAVANQKGGTGKTTTTLNLGSVLARKGENVLLVDMDSQANCGTGIGIKLTPKDKSIRDLLLKEVNTEDVIRETTVDHLSLIPSHLFLANIEMRLTTEIGGFRRLAIALNSVKDKYNHIIIDCPPSLGILCTNSIIACDEIIIPMEPETYALEGMEAFAEMLNNIFQAYGHMPSILGILLTKYRTRTSLHESIEKTARASWKGKVFDTVVRQNIDVSTACVEELPVAIVNPNCMGAQDYVALAEEVLDREKQTRTN